MKIMKVEIGQATLNLPEYRGNLVSDGTFTTYHDSLSGSWSLPLELFNIIEYLLASTEVTTLTERTKEVSVTDLLALKTTFETDDIIKLRESDLI